MFHALRRILHDVNNSEELKCALNFTVRRIKKEMTSDVCSIYLLDDSRYYHILMATDGLKRASVEKIRLAPGEGLVSLVAERAEPVKLKDASQHPCYHYFPEAGEDGFDSFIGVPIIHHRINLGVLVAQDYANNKFTEEHVDLLTTIATQLAEAIAHARAMGCITVEKTHIRSNPPLSLLGIPGSPGVAIGKALVCSGAVLDAVPDRYIDDIDNEIVILQAAVLQVKKDMQALSERLKEASVPQEDIALFDAYALLLEGDSLVNTIVAHIKEGNWAAGALRQTISEHLDIFEQMEDPYLRERGEDIKDLGRRILEQLQKGQDKPTVIPDNAVLVGEDISASMLAEIPRDTIVGVVSVNGSGTSHTAILARALGLPAVMGIADLPVKFIDDCEIIVDGYSGRVYFSPPEELAEEYRRLQNEDVELSHELDSLKNESAQTPDGLRIRLYANMGLIEDIIVGKESGAEGIGLYRTEYPFMIRSHFPGEEEQCRIYRQILKAFESRPVTLRTLDIGGDKSLPYFPIQEENPFLGWRGIRMTLDHPEIFMIQLRAMLLASEGLDNLNILFPMISSVAEVKDAKSFVLRAYKELLDEGRKIKQPKIGVMVEVPALVFQIKEIAPHVDYFSIGTNDLTQYLLAVDRNNAKVADYYDGLHPAVIQALYQTIHQAHKYKKPVSVCGEMGEDPAAVILLIGMSIDALSMSVAALPRIKWIIRRFSQVQARIILDKTLTLDDSKVIRQYLYAELEKEGLGGLIRAGR